jgi:hypothetical protein
MKFAELLSYWELKNLITHRSVISRTESSDKLRPFEIKHIVVSSYGMTGIIMYQSKGNTISLIHGDLVYTHQPNNANGIMFINRAKISDLANYLT